LIVADEAGPPQPQHILPKQFSLIAFLFKTFAVRHRVAPLDSSNNRVKQTGVPAYDFDKTQQRSAPIN
jgi:hypothetical protein